MLAGGGFFALLAMLAVISAIASGQLLFMLNGLVPALVSALFILVATRQSIRLDRKGVSVKGFGSAGRTVRWPDVDRLELTDASRWRLGPRLILSNGRGLPMPAGWRLEDDRRLPDAAVDWSRWAKIEIVGERTSGRRWPLVFMLVLGAATALLVAVARVLTS